MTFVHVLTPADWKRGVALVILWAYAYQLVVWPLWTAAAAYLSWWLGLAVPLPAPVIVPWEQLIAGTTTLATVGGIETWREGRRAERGLRADDKEAKP